MHCKYIYKSLILIVGLMMFSCAKTPFSIEKATHQRLAFSENSLGTRIEVFIPELTEDVEFTNLVFNKRAVPVDQMDWEKGGTKLVALFQTGDRLIRNTKQEKVDLPNQLQYVYKGKESYVLLEDLEFLPTKISRQ